MYAMGVVPLSDSNKHTMPALCHVQLTQQPETIKQERLRK